MKKAQLVARDVMRSVVFTVRVDQSVWDVAQEFSVRRITGAPVVDEKGRLVGVISQTDIVRHLHSVVASAVGVDFYGDAEPLDPSRRQPPVKVERLMSRDPVCASEDTPVVELSKRMLTLRIHRIIITKGDAVVGIVTTMDLLKVL